MKIRNDNRHYGKGKHSLPPKSKAKAKATAGKKRGPKKGAQFDRSHYEGARITAARLSWERVHSLNLGRAAYDQRFAANEPVLVRMLSTLNATARAALVRDYLAWRRSGGK